MAKEVISSSAPVPDARRAKGGLVAYSVPEKPLTPDEVRRKHFSNFYSKDLDGNLRVTSLFDS